MSAGELAPCYGIIEAPWTRIENQSAPASNSGDEYPIEFGDPYWSVEVSVEIRNRAHFDLWDSFLARRRLHARTFTMWRSMRPRPCDPLITSDAGLALSSIDTAASTITLSGYGANRFAHYGDMIGYRTSGGGYWVGQVEDEAQANGSGVVTIPVWPRPVAAHASPEPTRFKASAEFRLSEPPRIREGFKRWSIRFRAEQVLR